MEKKLPLFILAFLALTFQGWSQALPDPDYTYHFNGDLREALGRYDNSVGRAMSYTSDNQGAPLSAAQLNGDHGGRICLQPMTVNNSNSFTFSCLVNSLRDQWSTFLFIGNSSANGVGMMIKKGNTQTRGDNPVMFGGLRWEVTDTSIHIPKNRWQHFVLVKNLTQYTMYLNGVQIFQVTDGINSVTDSLRLGNDQQSFNTGHTSIDALLDEVNVYNQALTPTQIHDLFLADSAIGNYHTLGVVRGKAYLDVNSNCTPDAGEINLVGQHVRFSPGNLIVPVDQNGNFTAYLSTGQTYRASMFDSEFLRVDSICPDSATLSFAGDSARMNVGVHARVCPKLNVTLSASRRRRCFGNSTIVTVRNEGLAPSTASTLKLEYPDGLVQTYGSMVPLNSHVYAAQIPALNPDQQYTLYLRDSVLCLDSLRNKVLCQKASIAHAVECRTPTQSWDGSLLTIRTACDVASQSRRFVVTNNGMAMRDSTEYRFYVNDGQASHGHLKLAAGDSLLFPIPDAILTWLMEVDETPGSDPHQTGAIAWPCGIFRPQLSDSLLAYVNVPDSGLAFAEECLMVRDSYDPNELHVTPSGFGNNHELDPDTKLTYRINFENMGTASTEFISLRDTLSPYMDLSTYERGTESHTGAEVLQYLELGTNRPIVVYRWLHLSLPPNTVSPAGSQGYVTFSVRPFANIPQPSFVRNRASVYFDYNAPVVTPEANIMYTRPGGPTNPVNPPQPQAVRQKTSSVVLLFPNPASHQLTVAGLKGTKVNARITDALGRTVSESVLMPQAGMADLNIEQLAPGLYTLQLQGEKGFQAKAFSKQ